MHWQIYIVAGLVALLVLSQFLAVGGLGATRAVPRRILPPWMAPPRGTAGGCTTSSHPTAGLAR